MIPNSFFVALTVEPVAALITNYMQSAPPQDGALGQRCTPKLVQPSPAQTLSDTSSIGKPTGMRRGFQTYKGG